MRNLLDGKYCIVTGGSKGIGLAIVKAFLDAGATVEYYSRTKADIADNPKLIWTICDVGNSAELEAAVEKSIAASKVDVLVNNAGITRDGLIFRMTNKDWDDVLSVNLTSAFITSRAISRVMIKQRSGSIINISSVVGINGNGGQSNYSASKAGVIGLTKSLAKEVASRSVRVNAIAPGFIDTAMTLAIPDEAKTKLFESIPLKRAGKPEEIASVAVFLASDMSSYISGEVIKVDGGMAM